MIYFLLNIMLTFAWTLLIDRYSSIDFLTGFGVGYMSLFLTQPFPDTRYFKRLVAIFKLLFSFLRAMLASVSQVTWDVITLDHKSHPDLVYYPLDVKSDFEITLLANMISLTPGTLSLDLTKDKQFLIIHAMFAEDHSVVITYIKSVLEDKLLEVTRG